MHPTTPDPAFGRELIARGVAAVGLAGVALIHLLDAPGKFQETPYMGWMYVGLILACLATAAVITHANAREAWLAAIALSASAIVGFTLTRTVGLPKAHDDIGNWSEPLGLASLFIEGALISVAGYALTTLHPARALSSRVRTTLAAAR